MGRHSMFFAALFVSTTMPACRAADSAPAEAAVTVSESYKLGAGDKLRITVYNEPTLTGEYAITDAGNVSFPLIGNVQARGVSLELLQEAIRTRLAAGYVNDPRVSIEVLNYRPYYILGEVNKPGAYPFKFGLIVEQAVAEAGGYTYRANARSAFLRRADAPAERKVDLRRQPVPVLPGDTIRIGERYF